MTTSLNLVLRTRLHVTRDHIMATEIILFSNTICGRRPIVLPFKYLELLCQSTIYEYNLFIWSLQRKFECFCNYISLAFCSSESINYRNREKGNKNKNDLIRVPLQNHNYLKSIKKFK